MAFTISGEGSDVASPSDEIRPKIEIALTVADEINLGNSTIFVSGGESGEDRRSEDVVRIPDFDGRADSWSSER